MSPQPITAGSSGASEAAAWHWLKGQLAGRSVPAVLTIIGLGDVSLLGAIDGQAPGTRVLALEPEASRAREALAHPHVDAWRRSGRLTYLAAPDYRGADQAWRVFPTRFEQPPLLVHPDSASSPGLRAAMTVLAKIVFGVKANAEARRRFAPRYLTNSLRNLPDMLAGRDVRELTGVAQGRPAVVVGAGPSLERSLADLKRLGPRAVVIATDTSLRPLLLAGVVPQFVIALDPSELNARHLLALPPCGGTWLVAESALDPRAVSAFRGRTFWFRVAPHQPWPWLNELGFDVGRLDVWGSVLTAAFQLACLAGCDPIVMTGSDLSFPGGRPYVRGTTYEFDWAWTAASGTSVEETWRTQLAARKDVRVERDLTGAEVPTTSVMLEFRDWIVAQAAKSGRRLVNATGGGLLMGAGVEQAALSDVLVSAVPVPRLFDASERSRAPQSDAIAESLRAASAALAGEAFDRAPLAAWQEFSGEGFDAGRLAAALDDARLRLEAPPSDAPPSGTTARTPGAIFFRLPEALTELRARLAGLQPAALDAKPALEPAAILVTALERLQEIAVDASSGPDFLSFPDPALIGTVPVGAIGLWPESTRWAVLEFEALLAEAWQQPVPPTPGLDPAQSRVVPADAVAGDQTVAHEAQLRAAHGCLMLALEWLAAGSSLGGADALYPVVERLRALEALVRRAAQQPPPAGPAVELVLRASAGGRDAEVKLPVGLSEVAVARVMAGATRVERDHAWEIGAATTGALSIRAAVRVAARAPAMLAGVRASAITPRRLTADAGRALKVAGQVPGGALAVVDFGPETLRVDANGAVEPYQSWPRPITGALSLGNRGDVAWSNVWQPQHGRVPFLLYRPEPGADVVAFELSFRPARGVWWRDRLYLTCLPTRDSRGALAAWAPGEEPGLVLLDLPLQGLVPMGDELWLEPFVPGTPQTVGRQRAERGWRWTPGAPPELTALGPLGASSDVAVSGDWSARAYPQADVVTLMHRDGTRLELRCYNPLRVGWAGGSLIVSGAGGETLIFERLVESMEVR